MKLFFNLDFFLLRRKVITSTTDTNLDTEKKLTGMRIKYCGTTHQAHTRLQLNFRAVSTPNPGCRRQQNHKEAYDVGNWVSNE